MWATKLNLFNYQLHPSNQNYSLNLDTSSRNSMMTFILCLGFLTVNMSYSVGLISSSEFVIRDKVLDSKALLMKRMELGLIRKKSWALSLTHLIPGGLVHFLKMSSRSLI